MHVKFLVSNSTFECGTPVVHAARWESNASHRWYTPPDGTIKRAPPVVQAGRRDSLVRATGGTRRRERVKMKLTYGYPST